METLLDKFKREQGGLRRSRSVRASLRLIGNRWRAKDDEATEHVDGIKDDVVLTQIFNGEKDYSVAYSGIDGTYKPKTPNMAKRKQELSKPRKKSGDIDLTLKPQRHRRVEKTKFSDLFNKKTKSASAKELLVPDKIPPKAAAILHIHSPVKETKDKTKKRLKGMGKSESANVITGPTTQRRTRRGSESDMWGSQPRGCVNQAFVYSTPPKDRKLPISPSSYLKLQYGALLDGCGGELPSLSACAPLPPHLDKATRRQQKDARAQQDKIAQVNIHLQALFAAVEHGYIDKARNILDSTDVDVNSLNPDGLSPLDVAVLASNRQLARMLMEFGAKEGTQFKTPEALGSHLRRLSREAESRLHEVTGYIPERACREDVCRSAAGGQAGTMGCAGGTGSEKDKQTQHWERRARTLKRLVQGWQQARVPTILSSPDLEVCGAHSVTVRLKDPRTTQPALRDPPIVTKYKVEWSSRADFSNVCGCREVTASGSNCTRVLVAGLTRGRRYFFRASAGNVKGWGPFTVSVPRSVVPSSWHDVTSRTTRGEPGGAVAALEALANAAASARQRPPAQPPRLPRKKTATIRQLFTAASKFQKNLRRGVYLACIIYHEDKVLVTSEEFLPVIEVDETYPACIYTDFHWLMKVSCSWDEVKGLRSDMEKHTPSSIHFRLKLLTAAAQMQSALCIQDLGQLYHKPLRDAHGTVVLSCVNMIKSPKSVSALNSRWVPVSKLRRRVLSEDNTMGELLMASVHEQIAYHQVSRHQLPRGLYLGYLKLQSSVEVVRIVAPARTPNVPPHTRIRDNPHVSAEEWEYLKSQSGKTEEAQSINNLVPIGMNEKPSESQEIFLEQIASASRRLFRDMEIPDESVVTHRIYDLEVIELNNDVSFIMVCPPAEQACSVPGQKEILLQKGDLLSLPIQAFEMIHLQTYHTNILNKYSKLSCVLELDVALAAHSQREAFSCTELQTAKERLTKLEDLQNNLNLVWKAERWLMDLIVFARDKDKSGPSSGILLKYVLDKTPSKCVDRTDSENCEKDANLKIDLLQIPPREGKITKTSPGRGSWPGPAGNGNHTNLHPEFSKSEQQLSLAPRQTSVSTLNLSAYQYLPSDPKFARKGSADSQYTQSSVMSNNFMSSNSQFDIKSTGSHISINSSCSRLPPSRSEDTLVIQNENIEPKPRPHSINTSVSTSSSPLLTVKGFYPGSMISVKTIKGHVSESVQSLSSDSESQSCPLTTAVPLKIRPQPNHRGQCSVIASKSMTNVKSSEVDFTDTGQDLFNIGQSAKRQPLLETQEDMEFNNKVPKTDERHSDSEERGVKLPSEKRQTEQAGILQVFAAYETGLAAGTSLKLHVTPRTSAREVIDLVVKQLNMAAVLKGKAGPVYGPEKLQDFCLVAVIGARERCLRDDFRPLQLQNPWRKGRLYVRLKHDVLAALQHSAKQPAYI
ncbi:uncharacterized protein LOC123872037 isoform X2 [Maniola jurtina]|uniref:uncharacterized protein LOC123872037 isoform X2 n=1 Tax=Maniola jurtina TaxID=191418 RepID=UPI001E68C6D5|nr:uncharacterized protein LOC123872037 isoform X2 [Maniola jurtina]XP_045772115.1 uncharacterized protein LOC123872037 isoform X2 [Maniola jurtina]